MEKHLKLANIKFEELVVNEDYEKLDDDSKINFKSMFLIGFLAALNSKTDTV